MVCLYLCWLGEPCKTIPMCLDCWSRHKWQIKNLEPWSIPREAEHSSDRHAFYICDAAHGKLLEVNIRSRRVNTLNLLRGFFLWMRVVVRPPAWSAILILCDLCSSQWEMSCNITEGEEEKAWMLSVERMTVWSPLSIPMESRGFGYCCGRDFEKFVSTFLFKSGQSFKSIGAEVNRKLSMGWRWRTKERCVPHWCLNKSYAGCPMNRYQYS